MGKGTVLCGFLRVQPESRVMAAFQSAIVLSLILMLVFYLPYFMMQDGTMCTFCSARLEASSGSNHRLQRMEWEPPYVREATEDERTGEEAYGEAPRRITPMGTSSYLFCLFGAYRTGPNSFGVVGLGNKQQHLISDPGFECSWVQKLPSETVSSSQGPASHGEHQVIDGTATKYLLPDRKFFTDIEYITVVVHCTFESPVGLDGEGGELKMIANHDELEWHAGLQAVEFVAMVEQSGEYNKTISEAPLKYEYLYCGAPLFGPLCPHRLREWVAYHMKLFGPSSHFILYDAGGIGDELWRVLQPWVKLGRVTIMNVRQQARYHAFYRSQILISNDCLLRAKTLAKWTFSFDIDEFLHVSEAAHLGTSFHEVMSEMAKRGRGATSISFLQRPISGDHCVQSDLEPTLQKRQWAMEKLVYRRHVNASGDWTTLTHWNDVKYAFQAQYVQSVAIHAVEYVQVPEDMRPEDTTTNMDFTFEGCGHCVPDKLHYYHYRGSVSVPDAQLCKEFVDPSNTLVEIDGATHEYDNSMALLADSVKEFELATIGQVSID